MDLSATVAGDKQVRVFETRDALASGVTDIQHTSRDSGLRAFTCHADRVKRISTEDSPDFFLTVSEVGTHFHFPTSADVYLSIIRMELCASTTSGHIIAARTEHVQLLSSECLSS